MVVDKVFAVGTLPAHQDASWVYRLQRSPARPGLAQRRRRLHLRSRLPWAAARRRDAVSASTGRPLGSPSCASFKSCQTLSCAPPNLKTFAPGTQALKSQTKQNSPQDPVKTCRHMGAVRLCDARTFQVHLLLKDNQDCGPGGEAHCWPARVPARVTRCVTLTATQSSPPQFAFKPCRLARPQRELGVVCRPRGKIVLMSTKVLGVDLKLVQRANPDHVVFERRSPFLI